LDNSLRELVDRARRRDQAAFAELVQQFERTALAIAYSIVGDSATAGDVTQDAFVRAWQRIGKLDDPQRFKGWLGTIVRNVATDYVRRRPRDWQPAENDERLAIDPAIEADRLELRQDINAALAQLDELTRSAIVLRYYQQMDSKQIAELLELSPAAVDMRLSRGRAELKQRLAALNPNT
jgi:RNA polymerase sigma factor (sigma-70 family)